MRANEAKHSVNCATRLGTCRTDRPMDVPAFTDDDWPTRIGRYGIGAICMVARLVCFRLRSDCATRRCVMDVVVPC